jgi:hypothetical protein
MWRNRNFHSNTKESLDGIASKDLVWYVMTGRSSNTQAFAKNSTKNWRASLEVAARPRPAEFPQIAASCSRIKEKIAGFHFGI